jgi:putative sigma-54 modulation protein
MNCRVTARHFDMTEATKNYALEAMDGLTRYFDRIVDCHIILEKEKDRWRAECVLGVHGKTLNADSREDLLYPAVDAAIDKMERQLEKYKAKISHEKDRREIRQQNEQPVDENRSG